HTHTHTHTHTTHRHRHIADGYTQINIDTHILTYISIGHTHGYPQSTDIHIRHTLAQHKHTHTHTHTHTFIHTEQTHTHTHYRETSDIGRLRHKQQNEPIPALHCDGASHISYISL